jgi:hypothetical protein
MAEVTVASRKWRRRTRSFSALCDNMLTLDRTYGMQDDPSKLNQLGICASPCEMCVTAIVPVVSIPDALVSSSNDDEESPPLVENPRGGI